MHQQIMVKMKKTNLKMRMLLILGMIALFPFPMTAGDPPLEEIIIISEGDDPSEDPLDLVVYLNTSTGQIAVETYVNQWIWVFIINSNNGSIYSVDVIDTTLNNGSVYYTYAPSLPGNYCILFQSYSAEAYGYFTIN